MSRLVRKRETLSRRSWFLHIRTRTCSAKVRYLNALVHHFLSLHGSRIEGSGTRGQSFHNRRVAADEEILRMVASEDCEVQKVGPPDVQSIWDLHC